MNPLTCVHAAERVQRVLLHPGLEAMPTIGRQPKLLLVGDAHPCMIKLHNPRPRWPGRIMRSLGKPSHPEDRQCCLSLCVDWLPALFADTVEYPRLRACIHKDGRRLCRVGEPVNILPQPNRKSDSM